MQGEAVTPPPPAAGSEPELAQWFSPLGSSAGRIMARSTPNSAGMHMASSNDSGLSSTPSGNPFSTRQPEQAASVPEAVVPSVTGNDTSLRQRDVQTAGNRSAGTSAGGTFWTSAHAAELSNSASPERPPALLPEPQRRAMRRGSAPEGGREEDAGRNADPFGLFNAGPVTKPSFVQLTAARGDTAEGSSWAPSLQGAPDTAAAGGVMNEASTQQQGWPTAPAAASMIPAVCQQHLQLPAWQTAGIMQCRGTATAPWQHWIRDPQACFNNPR